MSTDPNRQDGESWYVANSFDLAASPIGSRDCALQWAAWVAASARQQGEQLRLRRLALEWSDAALKLQTERVALTPLLCGARDALAACNVAGWPEKLDAAIEAGE